MNSIREILHIGRAEDKHRICGWVRTKRVSPNVFFLALSDGSTAHHLQITGAPDSFGELLDKIHTGTCLQVSGRLVSSPGRGQRYELLADTMEVFGRVIPLNIPYSPKGILWRFCGAYHICACVLSCFGAIFRLRHLMSQAFHQFFSEHGFWYVHTPIITPSDCEGAGELFEVKSDSRQKDFFEEKVYLTVSGQLEAEMLAMGLSKVYTFAPTFRAENSNTTRHLSEFWMIEPEMAFCDLQENIDTARRVVQYVIGRVVQEGKEDIDLLHNRQLREDASKKQHERRMPLLDKLGLVLEGPWREVDYTEAYGILKASKPNKRGQFEYPVEHWGQALQTEHERFLVEQHFGRAVVVTNYPKGIKALYMRTNDDNKTVAAMDVLFPEIGEIVGGAQREERIDHLLTNMEIQGISPERMSWYIDSRRYGGCPHAGFGIGFDRLVLFVTGMENIRDVIPFPRAPGKLVL